MLYLVVGGAASGKSEFAENLALNMGKKRLYVATMQPFDEECHKRIKKHQLMRKDKGFETMEQYTDLANMQFENEYDVLLLECMSNLLANEMYATDNKDYLASVINGIDFILDSVKNTIVVSNEIFYDGDSYSQETLEYISALGKINAEIANKADVVIELVCGIPLYHKKRKGMVINEKYI